MNNMVFPNTNIKIFKISSFIKNCPFFNQLLFVVLWITVINRDTIKVVLKNYSIIS
ncbi:hypothetical protein T190130A13A_60213 [Tenacibaculum sp. 190130A14a]|uniref:Uncharacterized protein n=1 Tax=Tenacibaculum polynesiense TaxID=3137857 RepID=A0ABP1F7C3_9FLAO